MEHKWQCFYMPPTQSALTKADRHASCTIRGTSHRPLCLSAVWQQHRMACQLVQSTCTGCQASMLTPPPTIPSKHASLSSCLPAGPWPQHMLQRMKDALHGNKGGHGRKLHSGGGLFGAYQFCNFPGVSVGSLACLTAAFNVLWEDASIREPYGGAVAMLTGA